MLLTNYSWPAYSLLVTLVSSHVRPLLARISKQTLDKQQIGSLLSFNTNTIRWQVAGSLLV